MIKTAIVAMTVLGCDCDAKVCAFVSETPPQWSSIDDCKSAGTAAILRNSKLDYPLVTVECRLAVGTVAEPAAVPSAAAPTSALPATAPAAMAVSTTAEPSNRTTAIYSGLITSSRFDFRKTGDGYASVGAGFDAAAEGAIKLLRWSAAQVLASD
ncbi:MAG: hypothetical protein AB7P20_05500 [Rhizobiaceae bacterium]